LIRCAASSSRASIACRPRFSPEMTSKRSSVSALPTARVVHGLLELPAAVQIGVTLVADDERHALLRLRRDESAREHQPHDNNDLTKPHFLPP
jgi:hypothetical protein